MSQERRGQGFDKLVAGAFKASLNAKPDTRVNSESAQLVSGLLI
jgi:hypothetical protein